jgi:hypothetical protein
MKDMKNLIRMAAVGCVVGLAACGTERDALPVSDAPPAYEEAAPGRDAAPSNRNGRPRGPGDAHHPPADASPHDDGAPRLERGPDPLDFEAELRPRQHRNPVWVA